MRSVFNCQAKAYWKSGKPELSELLIHGLDYSRNVHRNPETGGYARGIDDSEVADAMNHCYGLAFVMLAYACALNAGVREAREWLYEIDGLIERRFWLKDFELYASEADSDWKLDR